MREVCCCEVVHFRFYDGVIFSTLDSIDYFCIVKLKE